jgi:TonB family protein
MDIQGTRARTRWTMTGSLVAHAVILLFMVLHRGGSPDFTPITEITVLEPGDLAPDSPALAPPAASGRTIEGLASKSSNEMHFRRGAPKGDVTPDAQSSWAFEDRLQARLAAMEKSGSQAAGAGIVATKVPTSLFGTSPAVVAGGTGLGTPVVMTRGGTGGGAPLPLARGGGSAGSAAAIATIPEAHREAEAPAPARTSETTARRTVAGASITGPIADRPVLSYAVPTYPEWAKHDAVEGAVTLYFVVRPDGGVRENILVQRTAGFEDFDENARAALRAWRFKALAPGQSGEQWGTITFRFRIRDAG